MSGKKRKREGFDEFLKKEIMTQERYDRLYGKQMPDYIGHEESRQAESGDEGAGAVDVLGESTRRARVEVELLTKSTGLTWHATSTARWA